MSWPGDKDLRVIVCVPGGADQLPVVVDPRDFCLRGAGCIEGNELAKGVAEESVHSSIHGEGVVPHNLAEVVDPCRKGLGGARDCECDEMNPVLAFPKDASGPSTNMLAIGRKLP